MSHANQQAPRRLPIYLRMIFVMVGGGLLALLAVAASLEPDPSGLGTHQGLGLPPCSLLTLTGRRCPSCGMTTSWANLVRGRVLTAVEANAGGTMLAATAALGGPWLLAAGLWGRWRWFRPNEYMLVGGTLAVVIVTFAQWGWRMLAD